MTFKSLAAAAFLATMSAPAADAATFNVLGTDYDLTTITGTFDDNFTLLSSQVWWGDGQLASFFAGITRKDLAGLPNSDAVLGANIRGPFFATGFGVNCPTCANTTSVSFNNQLNGFLLQPDAVVTFAVESSTLVPAVPLPAGGVLLLSGLFGVTLLKRRKKPAA